MCIPMSWALEYTYYVPQAEGSVLVWFVLCMVVYILQAEGFKSNERKFMTRCAAIVSGFLIYGNGRLGLLNLRPPWYLIRMICGG